MQRVVWPTCSPQSSAYICTLPSIFSILHLLSPVILQHNSTFRSIQYTPTLESIFNMSHPHSLPSPVYHTCTPRSDLSPLHFLIYLQHVTSPLSSSLQVQPHLHSPIYLHYTKPPLSNLQCIPPLLSWQSWQDHTSTLPSIFTILQIHPPIFRASHILSLAYFNHITTPLSHQSWQDHTSTLPSIFTILQIHPPIFRASHILSLVYFNHITTPLSHQSWQDHTSTLPSIFTILPIRSPIFSVSHLLSPIYLHHITTQLTHLSSPYYTFITASTLPSILSISHLYSPNFSLTQLHFLTYVHQVTLPVSYLQHTIPLSHWSLIYRTSPFPSIFSITHLPLQSIFTIHTSTHQLSSQCQNSTLPFILTHLFPIYLQYVLPPPSLMSPSCYITTLPATFTMSHLHSPTILQHIQCLINLH